MSSDTKSVHTPKVQKVRYELRRQGQGLLYVPGLSAQEQHRACFCGRGVRDGQMGVGIHRQVGGGTARYQGLTGCGDLWACPVCAAKIAGERRKDLERAMVAAHLDGYHGYLLTLTFPHEAGMELADVLGSFTKAMQGFQNGRSFKGFMERHGSIGRIKGLEVTHGGNGWHPHAHILVFARPGLLEDVRGLDGLRDAWCKALLKRGLGSRDKLSDMLAHALDFRGGDDAAAYIAKFGHDEQWGLSSEMTAGIKKLGESHGHHTPFQLLALSSLGHAWAGELFVEYVTAFRGKRALTWTPGLRRALLGDTDDVTDEALANLDEPAPEEEFVGSLTVERYQDILARCMEGELLYLIGTSVFPVGQAELDDLVDGLIAHMPRRRSGFIGRARRGVGRVLEAQAGTYSE